MAPARWSSWFSQVGAARPGPWPHVLHQLVVPGAASSVMVAGAIVVGVIAGPAPSRAPARPAEPPPVRPPRPGPWASRAATARAAAAAAATAVRGWRLRPAPSRPVERTVAGRAEFARRHQPGRLVLLVLVAGVVRAAAGLWSMAVSTAGSPGVGQRHRDQHVHHHRPGRAGQLRDRGRERAAGQRQRLACLGVSGASATMTVTSNSLVAVAGQLTVNPGGHAITGSDQRQPVIPGPVRSAPPTPTLRRGVKTQPSG